MPPGTPPSSHHGAPRQTAGCVVLLSLLAASTSAQVLEPRFYRNAPTGLNAVAFGYSFSHGSLEFDPALPIEEAEGDGHVVPVGYVRTFGIFGKAAKAEAVVPIGWGYFEGLVEGDFRTRDLAGIADPSGLTLEQQRLSTYKGSIVRGFRPGLWAALSLGYGTGGKTIVDGIPKSTYQKNWRFGASVSLPVRPGHAIRIFALSGVRQKVGSDNDVFGALYQITWLSGQ